MRGQEIRFEQAVYGSFPFWDRGYAVLAESPGCQPEWLAGLRAACQRYGERPSGAAEAGGLFAMRLEDETWMVVGVGPQGLDDRGRPGALAFHALFLSPREYRRVGGSPFGLAHLLRNDWTADVRALPSGACTVEPPRPTPYPEIGRALTIAKIAKIVAILAEGRRVAIESPRPIDDLARQVWSALPDRVRMRASVATWAFGVGNRFDLVALPRLASVELDPSYEPFLEGWVLGATGSVLGTRECSGGDGTGWGQPVAPSSPPFSKGGSRRVGVTLSILGALAVLAGVGLGLFWNRGEGRARPFPAVSRDRPPPDPSAYRTDRLDGDDRRRVTEALVDLAERFRVIRAGMTPPETDPTALMILLDERLRYRGPLLSADELTQLGDKHGDSPDRDRARAIQWHDRVRRFVPDRPLPDGFARGPLRWQLDTLAWSFHLDDNSAARGRSPAEIPQALGESLDLDLPLPMTPLVRDHPALASYIQFLGRLPRR